MRYALLVLALLLTACTDGSFSGEGSREIRHKSYVGKSDMADGGDTSNKDDVDGSGKSGDDDDLGNSAENLGSDDDSGKGSDLGSDESELGLVDTAFDTLNLCSTDNGTDVVGTNLTQESKVVFKLFPKDGGEPTLITADAQDIRSAIVARGRLPAQLEVADGTYDVAICAPSMKDGCRYMRPSGDIEDFFAENGGAIKAVGVSEGSLVVENGRVVGQPPRMWTMFNTKQDDDPAECDEDLGTGKNSSPLIVDLNGAGIRLSSPADGVGFDLEATGRTPRISWPLAGRGAFLALDRDGNGRIDSGNELFGNYTRDAFGSTAANGFLALARYDDNRDGRIDRADSVHGSLRLWSDTNRDGVSQTWELATMAAHGVQSVGLDYGTSLVRDSYGNEFRERAFVRLDTGERRRIVDVWFRIESATAQVTPAR